MRNRSRLVGILALGIALATIGQAPAAQAVDRPDLVSIRNLARDAYIWGLAPEFVYRFSHYQELVSAPVNTLKYGNNEAAWNNNATNAGDASVLYINAFIDFNTTGGAPMVLTVPPTTGQYYVANYLDAFVNGIGSIGNRTTPTNVATSYVLVSPTDPLADMKTVTLNGTVYPVLATDTQLNWLLIRIRANSLTAAAASTSVASVRQNVVDAFALNSLSDFAANGYAAVYPASFDNVTPSPAQTKQAQAWQSAPTNAVDFFTQVGDGLAYSPLPTAATGMSGTPISDLPPQYLPQYGATDTYYMPAYPQQATLDRFAPIGLTAAGFDIPDGWKAAELAALKSGFEAGEKIAQTAATSGTAKSATSYWSYLNKMIGTYANTRAGYLTRAIVVLAGGSANVPLDGVYPTMNSNDGSTQLDGNNTYSITFTPPQGSYSSYPVTGILPPMVEQGGKVAGFWSLVVYQPDATSSSAPFIPQTSVLNTAYSDATSTNVISVDAASDTLTVNAPAWGPIGLSTPLIFGANAADYGLVPGAVYYVAAGLTGSTAGPYTFQVSRTWLQELSPGKVPIQQSASLGGSPGPIVPLTAGTSPLTFGLVQPVSQLGSDQLSAGDLAVNADGSVTLWVGPNLPSGAAASNWIPTPSTAYYQSLYGTDVSVPTSIQAMIRMYYPTPGSQPPSILPLNSDVSTTYVLPPLVAVDSSGSASAVVAPGVVVVSDGVAANLKHRVIPRLLSVTIGGAGHVSLTRGRPVALDVQGMSPGRHYRVRIKVDGVYRDVGVVRATPNGRLALPALAVSRPGTYPLAVTRINGTVHRFLVLDVPGRS